MTKAHKSGNLSLAKKIVPADENTVFLAHYDITENDVLKGIAPTSDVATLRPVEGNFGGGVAVEEETTNFFTRTGLNINTNIGPDHFQDIASGTYVITNGTEDAFGGDNGAIIEITSGNTNFRYGYHTDSASGNGIDYGYDYTYSIYAKVVEGGDTPSSFKLDVVDRKKADFSSELTHQWQRFSMSAYHDNSTSYHFADMEIAGTGAKIALSHPQIERKTFSSSFVDGNRGSGKLQYSIPPTKETTVSFWCRRTGAVRTGQLINLFDKDEVWRLWLDVDANNYMSFSLYNASTGKSYGRIDAGAISSSQWTMVSFVFTGTYYTLYVNGEKVGHSSHSGGDVVFSKMAVGYHIDNAQSPTNVIVDELRVDKVERTDEEIEGWYISQLPFYPKGIYRLAY